MYIPWESASTGCFMESTYFFNYRPPFNAKNVIELKGIIQKQDIAFPKAVNKVSTMT
jgi:hypothetical protein